MTLTERLADGVFLLLSRAAGRRDDELRLPEDILLYCSRFDQQLRGVTIRRS